MAERRFGKAEIRVQIPVSAPYKSRRVSIDSDAMVS